MPFYVRYIFGRPTLERRSSLDNFPLALSHIFRGFCNVFATSISALSFSQIKCKPTMSNMCSSLTVLDLRRRLPPVVVRREEVLEAEGLPRLGGGGGQAEAGRRWRKEAPAAPLETNKKNLANHTNIPWFPATKNY